MNEWALQYTGGVMGTKSYGQESLLTLGNGYLGWRGTPVFAQYNENYYPGLYMANVFNKTTTQVSDRDVENEDLVNLPNPQLLKLWINDQEVAFEPALIENRDVRLNFKDGLLTERYTLNVPKFGKLFLTSEKVADPINYHHLGMRVLIKSDFNAILRVQSLIDGTVLNQNVQRYRDFDANEFEVTANSDAVMAIKTRTTDIQVALGIKTTAQQKVFEPVADGAEGYVTTEASFVLQAGQVIELQKVMAVVTDRETEYSIATVQEELKTLTYTEVMRNSQQYWKNVWQNADVQVSSFDDDLQGLVRMNIFHLHQAAQAKANLTLDASVGARGLTGDEQSQKIHLNPVNNCWEPDNSRRQRHVSLAIVYNLWIYTQTTGDTTILDEGGLAVVLEITKFWLNKVQLGEDGRYHLAGVMGPDEFHESYPGASEGGLKDNAYTNVMLAWALNWVDELADEHPVAFQRAQKAANFDDAWLEKVDLVRYKLALEIDPNGVIAQYAGYFDLQELNFKAYQKQYGDIHRIDRILKAEGKSPDDYQVAKQADTLMLLYNLGAEQTEEVINQLGYKLPVDWVKANTDFYLARTTHGSTTSRPVFAGIDVELGRGRTALAFLKTAIESDYTDIQGGTTAEGIHLGVMGETLNVIQSNFGGVNLLDKMVVVQPKLPLAWRSLSFKQKYRGGQLTFIIKQDRVTVTADHEVQLKIYNRLVNLLPFQTQTIKELQSSGAAEFTNIKGVAFDLDGVLANTACFHEQAWRQLAEEIGAEWDDELAEMLKGLSRVDSLAAILARNGLEDRHDAQARSELAERKNQYYRQLIEKLSPADVLPGINEFLQELKGKGYRMCVASASQNAPVIIKRLGLEHYFEAIVDPTKCRAGKPDPAIFEQAAHLLNLLPEEVMGVEDSGAGIESINAAGSLSIGIGDVHVLGRARINFSTTRELNLAAIVTRTCSY